MDAKLHEEQRDLISRWLPEGTAVRYWPGGKTGPGDITVTRSPVWALGCGTLAVKVEGASGGISLSHVEPVWLKEDALNLIIKGWAAVMADRLEELALQQNHAVGEGALNFAAEQVRNYAGEFSPGGIDISEHKPTAYLPEHSTATETCRQCGQDWPCPTSKLHLQRTF